MPWGVFGLVLVVAAALSAGLILALRPYLARYALARPNARSSHKLPTPQGGGIALVAATLGGIWLGVLLASPEFRWRPGNCWRLARGGAARVCRRDRRHPRAWASAAAARAVGRCRHRDRGASGGLPHRAAASLVGRARAVAARRRLVRQPRQFHGWHRLDDGRRGRARYALVSCCSAQSAPRRRSPCWSRWRCSAR